MGALDKSKGPRPFRSGYVSITGRPNVGKSTLLNSILGQKVSIVTSKPQTTRNRIVGIKSLPDAQAVFIDTPGIFRPRDGFGRLIVAEARKAVRDVDIVLFMVEPRPPSEGEEDILGLLSRLKQPVLLLLNKVDKVKKPALLPVIEEYSALYPFEMVIPVSALTGDGVELVLKETVKRLPEGPKYYPDDIVTDQIERFMVAEIIREKVMEATGEEVPHAAAVQIMGWTERKTGVIYIAANIVVERKGQKGIIIGKSGARLKAVGSSARKDIEGLLNAKVFLELWVKVRKNWRADASVLGELGYK